MEHKQRLRAGSQAMAMDDPEEQEDGIIVETGDKEPSSPSGGPSEESSPSAKEPEADDPIDVLKRQFAELQAEKEAEERRRLDAERRALELHAQTRNQAELLDRHAVAEIAHHKSVLEQAYAAEDLKAKEAKRLYSEALTNGDYTAAADAQEEMIRANTALGQYANLYRELELRENAPRPAPKPPSQDEQFEAALQAMHPKVAAWAREHKSDVLDPSKQQLALAADAMARARGYMPGSEPYMQYLDDQMGYASTQSVSVTDAPSDAQQTPKARSSMRAPSAPPSRTSGSSSGARRVHLTEDDKRQAQAYNVSLEEYAKWKLKADETKNNVDDPRRMQIKVYAGEAR